MSNIRTHSLKNQIFFEVRSDMRDITESYAKIQRELGFQIQLTPDDGIREVLHAIRSGLISNPGDQYYRNTHFIVQSCIDIRQVS